MYQLNPIKQYIDHQNEQLDGMNDIYDDKGVFSITLPSLTSNETSIWIS